MHHLELVDRSIHPTQEVLPPVVSGENACPPEDCGGIHGYKELLEVLKNTKHHEYRETKVWVGSKFNPTNFSVDARNKELGKLNKYMKEYEEGFLKIIVLISIYPLLQKFFPLCFDWVNPHNKKHNMKEV